MSIKREFAALQTAWKPLTLYEKFEHICILILTGLIAIVIAFATWNLALKILINIVTANFDPTDYTVFQAVFGMIFTVIIALEFKRSLLGLDERQSRRRQSTGARAVRTIRPAARVCAELSIKV